jgi:hypothetical protein
MRLAALKAAMTQMQLLEEKKAVVARAAEEIRGIHKRVIQFIPTFQAAVSKGAQAARQIEDMKEAAAIVTAEAARAQQRIIDKPLASSLVEEYLAERITVAGSTSQMVGQDRGTIRGS